LPGLIGSTLLWLNTEPMSEPNKELETLSYLLRCPVTGQRLHIATPEEIRLLSEHKGDGFLVSEDGMLAYPVKGGIPDLLPTDGIAIGDC